MPDAKAPDHGLLTWGAEGTEGGRFHSRVLQFPPGASGLTLGRGYDFKERSAGDIEADLVAAGVDAENAKTLGKATGLTGAARQKFVKDNKLEKFEITEEAQLALFEKVYAEQKAEVVRICDKADTQEAYGIVDFTTLDGAIFDIFIDLKFRGDYTGPARKKIQGFAATNDLEGLSAAIGDAKNWPDVPDDRFKRRKEFAADAVATRTTAGTLGAPHAARFPPHVEKPKGKGKKAKAKPGHHKAKNHLAHLDGTILENHRQVVFQQAHLRYTSFATEGEVGLSANRFETRPLFRMG